MKTILSVLVSLLAICARAQVDYNTPISVSYFGATGDGTDETAKLQAALNSPYKTVYLAANRTYRFTSLTVPSDKTFRGYGGSVLKPVTGTPASASYRVRTANSTTFSENVTIAIDSLATSFPYANAAKLTVGQLIELGGETYYNASASEPYAWGYKGKVTAINGTTVSVFPATSVKFTARTIKAYKTYANVHIKRITLDLSGRNDFGFGLQNCLNCSIDSAVVMGDVPNTKTSYQVGMLIDGIGNEITYSQAYGGGTIIPGYGFSAVGHYNTIRNCRAWANRHNMASANRTYISTQLLYLYDTLSFEGCAASAQSVDYHANAWHSRVEGCDITLSDSANVGIQLRGQHDTAQYNQIHYINTSRFTYGILFFENPAFSIARLNTLSVTGTGNNRSGGWSTKLFVNPAPGIRFINNVISTATSSLPAWVEYSGNTTNGSVAVPNTEDVVVNAGPDTVLFKNQSRPDTGFLSDWRSTGTVSSRTWQVLSYPAGSAPVIASASAAATTITGLQPGFTTVRLTLNGTDSDTLRFFVRDFMKKNVTASRAGGGIAIQVPPNYSGTYTKKDGTPGRWNKWNFLTDLPAYLQSKGLPVPMGGDTLYFEGGADSTAWIELGNFGGNFSKPVYIMPGSKTDETKNVPVYIRGAGSFFRIGARDSNVVCHVVVDGTNLRSKGFPYGFIVDNSGLPETGIANGGLNATWVHHFTVKGLKAVKTKWGIQIQLQSNYFPPSRYDKFIQAGVAILDNYIDSALVEGMYIGNSDPNASHGTGFGPGARMDSVLISGNVVLNSGWDGIQVSNARNGARICNNFVFNSGWKTGDPAQQCGILLGGNTRGDVDSNVVLRSRGPNIQVLSYGVANVRYNVADSAFRGDGTSDGIYLRGTPVSYDGAANPELQATIAGNIIARYERKAIYFNALEQLAGTVSGNTVIDPLNGTFSAAINNPQGAALSGNVVKTSFPLSFYSVAMGTGGAVLSVKQGSVLQTYDNDSAGVAAKINRFFLAQNTGAVVNIPPTANAGTDKVITLPTSSVTLAGTGADADGTVTYSWAKMAGPGSYVITNASAATCSVSGLTEGSYTFRLTVTDNKGAGAYDDVSVTVQPKPKARRGQVATAK